MTTVELCVDTLLYVKEEKENLLTRLQKVNTVCDLSYNCGLSSWYHACIFTGPVTAGESEG